MRLYYYVGPRQIAARSPNVPTGTPVGSAADVIRWVRESGQHPTPDGGVIATFVVDQNGVLLVADRRSEHVACAGREPVRSAGEITFRFAADRVEVAGVSNQSTGYCPEPESWPAVAAALVAAGIEPPEGFTLACIFRLCPQCGCKNLVKGGVFECGVCAAILPTAYNCQGARSDWAARSRAPRSPGMLSHHCDYEVH